MRAFLIVLFAACEPTPLQDVGRDPKLVHGRVAEVCAVAPYAPAEEAGSLYDLELVVEDTMQGFVLQGVCLRLDGAMLVLANATELGGGRQISGHVKVTSGEHRMELVGRWIGKTGIARSYKFEVKTTHTFDASKVQSLRVTAYESDESALQDRPRIAWKEDPRAR